MIPKETRQETYSDRLQAQARITELKLAGYRAYAVGMDDGVRVTIEPGKHPDLSRLPEREWEIGGRT